MVPQRWITRVEGDVHLRSDRLSRLRGLQVSFPGRPGSRARASRADSRFVEVCLRSGGEPFLQRFSATISDEGDTIAGRWEKAPDGEESGKVCGSKTHYGGDEVLSCVLRQVAMEHNVPTPQI